LGGKDGRKKVNKQKLLVGSRRVAVPCRRNVSCKAIEVYRKANLDGLNPTICTAMNEAKKEEELNGSW